MFSFLKKKNITIDSVLIPTFGWNKIENSKFVRKWGNPEQTAILSLNFFSIKPDLPTVKDLDYLRSFYRNSISTVNGGLINVDTLTLYHSPVVKTIFKISQEEYGMIYIASLTIPFEDYSFVVKIQTVESGMTGLRDSVILNKLLESGEVSFENEEIKNWFSDPYDSDFKQGVLMNKSEDEKYDNEFPDHPLTIARIMINKISKEIILTPELASVASFNK